MKRRAETPVAAVEEDLDRLVAAVLTSPKYRSILPDLVRTVGSGELSKRNSLVAAIKTTKRKLHQVAGAYWEGRASLDGWTPELRGAEKSTLADVCRRMMKTHASTRERLPYLEEFYATTLAGLPPIRSVLDIGCGLNPLAIPWMPLAPACVYRGCDVYRDVALILNQFLGRMDLVGTVEARDVLGNPPVEEVDLALVLKMIPCLEQLDREAPVRLLDALSARVLLVSFPVHSLGGRRDKGMAETYARRFEDLARGRHWDIDRFIFPAELVFRVRASRISQATPGSTKPQIL